MMTMYVFVVDIRVRMVILDLVDLVDQKEVRLEHTNTYCNLSIVEILNCFHCIYKYNVCGSCRLKTKIILANLNRSSTAIL